MNTNTSRILPNEPSNLPQLDATMLRNSLHCRRYFFWRHVRNLTAIEPKPSLAYGIAIHAMLAEWHKTRDFRSALIHFDAAWLKHSAPEGDDKRNPLRAAEIMNSYRQYYSDEPFETVGTEVVGALPIGTFILVVIIDLVADYKGYGLLPMDHKTTSFLNENWWKQMHPAHQYTGYLTAMRSLFGKNCNSLFVNGILVDKKRCLFERRPTSRSDWELSQWIKDMNFHWECQLKPCYDHNIWPQNTDECQRWPGGCEFHSLCTTVGIDYRELEAPVSQFKVEKWDPLAEER